MNSTTTTTTTSALGTPPLDARRPTLPVLALSLALAGCGSGLPDDLAPRATLRTIDPVDPAALASPDAPRPTTNPVGGAATTSATQPATPAASRTLSLERVRQLAMANNLDLNVELLNPTIARQSLTEAEAAFEALFTTDASYSKIDAPTASELSGSQVEDFGVTPGLELPLRTGGTVRIDAPFDRNETNNEFATLNPAYTSDARVSLSQPLLRGFGTVASEQRIRVAAYRYQQTEARTKLEVIRVLANAERTYWRMYAARQELLVRKQEYDLAVAQLERARRQVAAGVAAEVEITRAESGVADRVEAIITAENAVRDRQRELKRVLNEPDLPLGGPTTIVPETEPLPVPYAVDPDRAVDLALDKRMELLELELRIAEEASNVRFARNDTLPLVALDYTYGVNGLGSSWGDSLEMTGDRNFEDHFLGLRVEVPVGNQAARSRLRAALARRQQELAAREQRVALIRQEVLNAVDQLQANWQRILAARQRVVLNSRLLDVEVRQFEQGLRTSTEVLEAQANLANARSSEIAALTEYQISQVDLAFATGMLLGQAKVVWDPAPVPRN